MVRVGLRCGEEFEDATCAVDDEWPESVGIGVGIFARMVLSKAKPPSRGTALKVSRPSWGSGIRPSWGGRLEFASMGAHKTTQKKTYQFIVSGKGSQKPSVMLCNGVVCQKKTSLRKYEVLDRVDSENPAGNQIRLACDGHINTYKVTHDMHPNPPLDSSHCNFLCFFVRDKWVSIRYHASFYINWHRHPMRIQNIEDSRNNCCAGGGTARFCLTTQG